MKHRVPVSQIMTKDVVKLTTKNTLFDAEKLFKEHNIRHLPVVSGNQLIGILSYSDLLRISFSELSDNEEKVDTTVYNAGDGKKSSRCVTRPNSERCNRNFGKTKFPLSTSSRKW